MPFIVDSEDSSSRLRMLYLPMITRLVQSAFSTGCLSVESEGLIRQLLSMQGYSYKPSDLAALERLHEAVNAGRIQREAGEAVRWLPSNQS